MNDTSKPWWASQAVWGGLAAIGSAAASAWLAFKGGNLEVMASSITAVFGGLMAIIGRVKAVAPIGSGKTTVKPAA